MWWLLILLLSISCQSDGQMNESTTVVPEYDYYIEPPDENPPYKARLDRISAQYNALPTTPTEVGPAQVPPTEKTPPQTTFPGSNRTQPPQISPENQQLLYRSTKISSTDDQATQFGSGRTLPADDQASQFKSAQSVSIDDQGSQLGSGQTVPTNTLVSPFRSAQAIPISNQAPQSAQTLTTDSQAPSFRSAQALSTDDQESQTRSVQGLLIDGQKPQFKPTQPVSINDQNLQLRSAQSVPNDAQEPQFRSVPTTTDQAPLSNDNQTPQFRSVPSNRQGPEPAYQRNPSEEEINYRSSTDLQPQTQESSDYCTLGENHTMCAYVENGCNKNNIDLISSAMERNDIHIALGLHNYLRHQVSMGRVKGLPSASPEIPSLEWDTELAAIAQRWADQCTMDHDFNRRTERIANVGQNVYWIGSTTVFDDKSLWKQTVEKWFDEVMDFIKFGGIITNFGNSQPPRKDFWRKIGGFTQVVWSRTRYLGCGQFILRDTHSELRYQAYMVCNYAPAGNIKGLPIYSPKMIY